MECDHNLFYDFVDAPYSVDKRCQKCGMTLTEAFEQEVRRAVEEILDPTMNGERNEI